MPDDAAVDVPRQASAVPERQGVGEVRTWVFRNTATLLVVAVFGATFGGIFGLVTAHMSSVESQFDRLEIRFTTLDTQLERIDEKIDDLPTKKDHDEMKERLLSIEEFLRVRGGAGSGGQRE